MPIWTHPGTAETALHVQQSSAQNHGYQFHELRARKQIWLFGAAPYDGTQTASDFVPFVRPAIDWQVWNSDAAAIAAVNATHEPYADPVSGSGYLSAASLAEHVSYYAPYRVWAEVLLIARSNRAPDDLGVQRELARGEDARANARFNISKWYRSSLQHFRDHHSWLSPRVDAYRQRWSSALGAFDSTYAVDPLIEFDWQSYLRNRNRLENLVSAHIPATELSP